MSKKQSSTQSILWFNCLEVMQAYIQSLKYSLCYLSKVSSLKRSMKWDLLRKSPLFCFGVFLDSFCLRWAFLVLWPLVPCTMYTAVLDKLDIALAQHCEQKHCQEPKPDLPTQRRTNKTELCSFRVSCHQATSLLHRDVIKSKICIAR